MSRKCGLDDQEGLGGHLGQGLSVH